MIPPRVVRIPHEYGTEGLRHEGQGQFWEPLDYFQDNTVGWTDGASAWGPHCWEWIWWNLRFNFSNLSKHNFLEKMICDTVAYQPKNIFSLTICRFFSFSSRTKSQIRIAINYPELLLSNFLHLLCIFSLHATMSYRKNLGQFSFQEYTIYKYIIWLDSQPRCSFQYFGTQLERETLLIYIYPYLLLSNVNHRLWNLNVCMNRFNVSHLKVHIFSWTRNQRCSSCEHTTSADTL